MASRAERSFEKNIPINQRGDWNIPKKYLKAATYTTVGDDTGYFIQFKGMYFPIEFIFTNCFWYLVKYNKQKSCWESNKIPTEDYNLNIPDNKVTDWSELGPINGATSNHSDVEDTRSEGQPESIDIKIPTLEEEKRERQLEKLAVSIPTLTRPRSNPATSRLPPITTVMTTQTITEPIQAIASEGERTFAWRGGGPPEENPNPRWFGGSGNPLNFPRGGDGGSGGGSGGGGGDSRGDPNNQGLGNKLSGKEPAIFDGDCSKAEAFILEWTIYMLLNKETKVMSHTFSRAMLFLTYIKGPNIQEWVSMQVAWLGRWVHQGARRTEEYLYNTIMDSFNSAFTDTMNAQKAKAEFQNIKMEGGDLDAYIAKFERLARLAGYDLQNQLVLDKFGSGFTSGLDIAIVNSAKEPWNWTDWVWAVQKFRQKYLLICTSLGMKGPREQKQWKKPQTAKQWNVAWKNKGSTNPNAMDTTPDHIQARKIEADKRTVLMQSGKCFTCKKQGQLSHDCPQRPPQWPHTNAHTSTSQIDKVNSDDKEPTKVRSRKKKYSAPEIMEILRDVENDVKDTIIQDCFMKEDF